MDIVLTNKLSEIKNAFGGAFDLVTREIETPHFCGFIIYLEGLIDVKELEDSVLLPIINRKIPFSCDLDGIKSVISYGGSLSELSFEQAIKSIASGSSLLVTHDSFIEIPAKKQTTRAISEPPTSSVIKGPREGFVEDLKTNVVILRKKINSEKLAIEPLQMGTVTSTKINIVYIRGIANEDVVKRLKEQLSEYTIDGILDSSYITKLIERHPYSIFKQVGNSEKPDIIAMRLLNGKVAIMVDGSPIVLFVPFMLMDDFEDTQDHYKRPMRVTFLRYVRLFAAFVALLLPALFVSVELHQFQILPLNLLITIINVAEQIPFTPTLEMLIALILFEILGEASIRMPRHVGMALSVVGAIVLGDTAVKAGLLSSITVLVVAISGIGIYAVPDEVGTIGILRILFVIVANYFGVFGILLSGLIIVAYMTNLGSYGQPYLMPITPIDKTEMKDALLKHNVTDLFYRPESFNLKNKTRLRKLK